MASLLPKNDYQQHVAIQLPQAVLSFLLESVPVAQINLNVVYVHVGTVKQTEQVGMYAYVPKQLGTTDSILHTQV